MRLHRMISILLLVEAKGKIKAKEIASELEISVRTVYRDVETLCEAGVPLASDTGPNGGIHFMEGYKVGIKDLEAHEIINLYLGGMGVSADKKTDMAMKVNTALLKLQQSASAEINEDINKIKKRYYVDDAPWWGEKNSINNIVDVITQGVWQSTKLKIIYEKQNKELSERIISPYAIVIKHTDWYLAAYCEKSKDIRIFKCERIRKCKKLHEAFVIPSDFFIEDFWNKKKKIFINQCSEKEKYPVTIRLKKCMMEVLKDFEIYSIKEEEPYVEAVINLYKYEVAKDDVLRLIGCCQVLQPIELRNYACQELQKMLEFNYEL